MALHCRFYESRFPEQNAILKVCVHSVGEIVIDVRLLEYDNIEGMILLSELTRRRIRSVNKLVRVGRPEYVLVMRVDQEKGYIDLSKRRVSNEEADKCEEKYSKAKAVNSILCHVASLLGYDTDQQLEELYTHVEVACTRYEGVDAVKRALRKGLELTTDDMPIKINLISPPLFVVSTTTLDCDAGISKLTGVLDVIKASIAEEGGLYHTHRQPRVINDSDELYLARRLRELEEENREISGDDNSENNGNETSDESCSDDDRATVR